MNFNEYQAKVKRVEHLVRLKCTGPPKVLAKKLCVSERTVYRLLNTIKEQNIDIEFCRELNTYMLKK